MVIPVYYNEECQKHGNSIAPLLLPLSAVSFFQENYMQSVLTCILANYLPPERRSRTVKFIEEFIDSPNYEFKVSDEANEEDILRFHTKRIHDIVKNPTILGLLSGFFGTEINEQTYPAALASAGIAIDAATAAVSERKHELYFGLCRPPGHHAGRNSITGFCYFNNMNIAVLKLLEKKTIENALIIDFDAHCGNGIHDLADTDNRITYIDIPLVGKCSKRDKPYLKHIESVLEDHINEHYDVVGICAGFDGHEGHKMIKIDEDKISSGRYARAFFHLLNRNGLLNNVFTLGQNILNDEHYANIGKMLSEFSSQVSPNKPFAILEGGYHPGLYKTIDVFCQAFEKK